MKKGIELVNRVIFKELCVGNILDTSRKEFSRIISNMKNEGSEAVILECSEIGLLVHPEDSVLKTYDTTDM